MVPCGGTTILGHSWTCPIEPLFSLPRFAFDVFFMFGTYRYVVETEAYRLNPLFVQLQFSIIFRTFVHLVIEYFGWHEACARPLGRKKTAIFFLQTRLPDTDSV